VKVATKTPLRRTIRRASWMFGTISVAASIVMFGYVSHAKGLNQSQIKRMQMVSEIIMFNGVGLCLISRRKKSNLVILPFLSLLISTGIGFGHIPLVKMSQE
jgi:hypothetical protein